MKFVLHLALLGLGIWVLVMGWQTAYYPIMETVVEGAVIGAGLWCFYLGVSGKL